MTVTSWVITDGKAGMESQCRGLAEALGLEPIVKRLRLRAPWRRLSPVPLLWATKGAISPDGDRLDDLPPPDILIASGRKSIIPSLLLGKWSGGRTFRVQIQNPVIAPWHFDLVVSPAHDRISGPNVVVTKGALHRLNPRTLAEARSSFAETLENLPRPRIAALIGGNNDVFRFTPAAAERLAGELTALVRHEGGSLLVTTSRRTGRENVAILRRLLQGVPGVFWADESDGANPYFGYLAFADSILVTEDSVNMACEAAATGKPVHIIGLEGGSAKFRRFHRSLRESGITRPFSGRLEVWNYDPPDDMGLVAGRVRTMLAQRGIQLPEPASQ
jgi:mitochondrial fission protein ELM1